MLPSVRIAGRCQRQGCSRMALGEDAKCWDCNQALCRKHYDADDHSCRYSGIHETGSASDHDGAIRDLDEAAIIRRVEELRPGRTCSTNLSTKRSDISLDLTGAYGVHLTLEFDNGVEWLVRVPCYPLGPCSPEFSKRIRHSEVITYEVLKAIGLPVATIHDWGCGRFSKSGNPHCAHIIYSKMPGKPDPDCLDDSSEENPDEDQVRRLVDQYATFAVKLSGTTFDAIGGLDRSSDGTIVVGGTTDFMFCDEKGAPHLPGPYHSLKDRYLAAVDHLASSIRSGYIGRAVLLLPYLRCLELRRFLRNRADLGEEKVFYLWHTDLSERNMLFEAKDITAIVDWEWATTTTKAEAFASPAWIRGYGTELSTRETMLREAYIRLDRPDLAKCVDGGRLYHDIRDAFYINFDRVEYTTDVDCLNRITESPDDAQSIAEWGLQALERWRDDPHLQDVIELDGQLAQSWRAAVHKEWNTDHGPPSMRWTPASLRAAVEGEKKSRGRFACVIS